MTEKHRMTSKKNHRKRLFLIDGYAMLYRSHFALIRNPLITSYGLHTSALFGFMNQLLKLVQKEQPDYIAAVFDSKEKTFRHDKYPEYKATREKMPDELKEQLPHLWKLMNATQIVSLSKPGFEADDIIGTLAKQGTSHDFDVYIVSGDKDFMQLVNDHVFLYAPRTRNKDLTIYDREKVIEKWGVPPEKIIDLLGLMGDSSDNIPGVRGVGEKSAVKLIKEFGSLESSLENAERVGNKRVRNGLLEYRDNAILSKELVTIDTNVELDASIPEMERTAMNIEALDALFTEFEFSGLKRQLPSLTDTKKPTISQPKKVYKILKTKGDVQAYFKQLTQGEILSVDLETTSVDPMRAEIVGFCFSVKEDEGMYIPVMHKDKTETYFGEDETEAVLSILKPILEDTAIPKTGQNIKYDALILNRYGIQLNGIAFDTMIASHMINPDAGSRKLDVLAMENLNYQMVPIEELIGKGKSQITMAEVPFDKSAFYGAEDADITRQLTSIFQKKLEEQSLHKYFTDVELPLIDVLVNMEHNGVYVDKRVLGEMSYDLGKTLHGLTSSIVKEAGTEFNVNSTQQLASILFDIVGLPKIRKRSTAVEVLEQLKDIHPLPKLILEYRKLYKLKHTYLDPLKETIHPETGRIHTSFNQTVAATGRLSSSKPNFQNIPIRTEIGKEIRKAFTAQQDGWKILSADYSQIELRIMAHLSQDPGLIQAFEEGEDVHSRTASLVFGVPIEEILPEMRRTAKIVNFGIMYGAGPFRMSQELGIPRQESQALIDTYFRQYSGIQNYIDKTLEKARTDKYVETMLGRRRPVWNADSDNRNLREAAERMAINMPIQGTAAEMIKLAMIHIHKDLIKHELKTKMILQIHDELIFEVPEDEIEVVKTLVLKKMEEALPLSVPIVVDCGIGNSWFEAH